MLLMRERAARAREKRVMGKFTVAAEMDVYCWSLYRHTSPGHQSHVTLSSARQRCQSRIGSVGVTGGCKHCSLSLPHFAAPVAQRRHRRKRRRDVSPKPLRSSNALLIFSSVVTSTARKHEDAGSRGAGQHRTPNRHTFTRPRWCVTLQPEASDAWDDMNNALQV